MRGPDGKADQMRHHEPEKSPMTPETATEAPVAGGNGQERPALQRLRRPDPR